MQVHSAQTNKKNLCLRFWVSPSLASVSFLAKLAWLIIVFFLIKMVNAALWTLLKTAKTVLVGSLWCSPVALELCCGGSTLGGGRDFAILRSSSRDFCALAFGPQRNVCHWPAHCESLVFHFAFVPHFYELGHYAAKFRGKLIVFGSAVFYDIRNHIASVVFESVNIFFVCFCCFVFFLLANDHFFYICWVWAQSLISLCFIGFSRVTEP